jgi:ferritin-like protein
MGGSDIAGEIERLLEEMIAQQRQRVLVHARRLNPRLTDDDVQQPQDFAELAGSPEWNYEDGILAGYQAVQAAVRATLRKFE